MIIDVFPYAYVPEVLLIRMQELADVVDVHVIVEADRTHTGAVRTFAWPALSRTLDFTPFRSKVVFRPVQMPRSLTRAWHREEWLRSECLRRVADGLLDHGDLVLFGDHDEIPNPRALEQVAKERVKLARLWGAYHEWYLNLRAQGSPGYRWEFRQPITFWGNDPMLDLPDAGQRFRALQWHGCDDAVEFGHDDPEYRGWHLTLQGGVRAVHGKLQIGAHTELQRLSLVDIQGLKDKHLDILRRCPLKRCPDDEIPQSVLRNRRRYAEMMLQ